MYTGPVVLKDILPTPLYNNFLSLSISIYLMLSPTLCAHYCDYADDLIRYFLEQFGNLYGIEEMVYNFYSLCHLADDVRRFGSLDRVSAFPFENFLGHLKRKVRKPQHILQQIAHVVERQSTQSTQKKSTFHTDKPKLGGKHTSGPTVPDNALRLQYKRARFQNAAIKCKMGDNCVMINGQLGLVENILFDTTTEETLILLRPFLDLAPMYTEPINSPDIGIFTACELAAEVKLYKLSDIEAKYVLLPLGFGWAATPLLHLH